MFRTTCVELKYTENYIADDDVHGKDEEGQITGYRLQQS